MKCHAYSSLERHCVNLVNLLAFHLFLMTMGDLFVAPAFIYTISIKVQSVLTLRKETHIASETSVCL
jgi:hypothetical protein